MLIALYAYVGLMSIEKEHSGYKLSFQSCMFFTEVVILQHFVEATCFRVRVVIEKYGGWMQL